MFEVEPDMRLVIDEGLENVAKRTALNLLETNCPHCGLRVRWPMIAREWQVKALTDMMRAVEKVCKETGVSAMFLSGVLSKCYTAIAMRGKKT